MAASSAPAEILPGKLPRRSSRASEGTGGFSLGEAITRLLAPAASLNLTVALLCMAIFLVFVGTLAQDEQDMWEVVRNYFRSFLTFVEFEVFFPKAWFPSLQGKIPGGLYFPGGLTIGAFMALNLFAAHATRFKVQASGARLMGGLLIILFGALVAFLVILGGHNSTGLQDEPAIGWGGVWYALKTAVVSAWLASVIGGALLVSRQGLDKPSSWIVAGVVLAFTAPILWLLYMGEGARLSESSLRILWQLAQGWVAALIMLGGCYLAFNRRAGIVLLHLGVALIMFNELFVGLFTVEERIHIEEGQIVNFARDIRSVEMAIIDGSNEDEDQIVALPVSNLSKGQVFRHELLPFDVKLVEYHKNADLRALQENEEPIATRGEGQRMALEPLRSGSGADTDSSVDMAAAYVQFLSKNGGADLGIFLLSQILGEQERAEKVAVEGKNYQVVLRFKRNYKPYAMRLHDIAKRDYVGTATPRDYSSTVHLIDPSRKFDRDGIRIWMNNPLRYAGETFYQSGYNRGRNGIESTDLQVVTNTGWMIPYLGCMVVATGLLAQFGATMWRFILKLTAPPVPAPAAKGLKPAGPPVQLLPAGANESRRHSMRMASIAFAAVVVLVCGGYLASKTRSEKLPPDGFDIHAFGKLPLVYQGRVKPFDTLARNSLRIISDREDFKDEAGRRQPAIRFLLDLISEAKTKVKDPETGEDREIPRALTHKIFRIENDQVLDTLGLPPRTGSYRYSAYEMLPKMQEFEEQVEKARRLKAEELSIYQKKVLALDRKIRTFTLLGAAFRTLDLPAMPTEEEFRQNPEKVAERAMDLREKLQQIPQIDRMLSEMQPPLAIPVPVKFRQEEGSVPAVGGPDKWVAYARAWHEAYVKRELLKQPENPAAEMMHKMLAAYASGNNGAFNRELREYQEWLVETMEGDRAHVASEALAIDVAVPPDDPAYMDFFKVRFEAFFNNFAPFYYSAALYLIAFLLALLGFLLMPLGWSLPFRNASFWLMALTFAVHCFALLARIYISGRPPVTNLYSSAVFIGWAIVLAGLVIEAVSRLGIGNLVGSVAGFATLIIAHNLAGDGDTFTVLQAVLDTQFWLATHVTCVTLGYAATFVAGAIGIVYVILGVCTPLLGIHIGQIEVDGRATPASVNENVGRIVGWMIYGTLCFALLLSFVGTVLGGLWADDSWGRFWGWDPKENGALIIVLWNAVILHARWGGLIKDRGLAVLAILGNIVTSWSWFGVNELGIGLHSYGFTEGVLRVLGLFVASQLLLAGLGCLPKQLWVSFSRNESGQTPAGEGPISAEILP